MDDQSLEYFCETVSKLHSVVIRVYEDGSLTNLIKSYGNKYSVEETKVIPIYLTSESFKTNKNIALLDINQFVLGYIEEVSTKRIILIGPVRFGEITENDIMEILSRFGYPRIMKENISLFLYSTPVMPIENFVTLLSMFNLAINNKIISISQIMQESNVTVPDEEYIQTADIELPHSNGEYENTLWFYIKNGMVDEIEQLNAETFRGNIGKLGPNQLRSLKNAIIALNTICLRAAISGGLDTETAYSLGERYVQRIESATSIPDLGKLTPILRKDYCQRVKNLSAPKIDNLYILKVTEYVQKNLYSKITVSEMADEINISTVYLSALAKQHLNCTLPQYINRQKVFEAKKLLRFTDKTLSEIANLLCFSSQSHFQNQFKKIRGITPAEYREKYRKKNVEM